MNIETRKVAIACFLGGLIGAFVGLKLGHVWCWAGLLMGGGIGYLSYEFGKVLGALKTAWRQVGTEYQSDFSRIRKILRNFKTGTIEVIKGIAPIIYHIGVLLYGTVFMWTMGLFLGIGFLFPTCDWIQNPSMRYQIGVVAFFSLLFTPFCSCLSESLGMPKKLYVRLERMGKFRTIILYVAIRLNPFVVFFYWLPKGAVRVLGKCAWLKNAVVSFLKKSFILIHSELRLLCLADAMIGAAAGYYCGNALIGGLVGSAAGIVNYQIVSLRWLKLVPR